MTRKALSALAAGLLLALSARAGTALPGGFVRLSEIDPTIRQDMRYHGPHNFIGSRIDGYDAADCILTRAAAEALARVQTGLRAQNLSLKVFDCYRPQRAVNQFLRWAADPTATKNQSHYYPNVGKPQLISEVYIAGKSGHSRGSTVDLTIVKARAKIRRQTDTEDGCGATAANRDGQIDMGTGFDCFDPRANTDNPGISAQQRDNRRRLRLVMEQQGFQNYSREWWHYTLHNEPFTDHYFDFAVR